MRSNILFSHVDLDLLEQYKPPLNKKFQACHQQYHDEVKIVLVVPVVVLEVEVEHVQDVESQLSHDRKF